MSSLLLQLIVKELKIQARVVAARRHSEMYAKQEGGSRLEEQFVAYE